MTHPLQDLLAPLGIAAPAECGQLLVSGASQDSRRTEPGDLFFAVPGVHVDGHDYVGRARDAGAVAAVVERRVDDPLPQIVVDDVLAVMPALASAAYGHPSRDLTVWTVTGSNGKTTCAYLIESVGRVLGKRVGVIGTIEYRWPGIVRSAPNTTPFAADLQRLLAEMRDAGVEWVALESSSHAIDQRRVDSVHFAGALFTNLSPEHLDYHRTMEAYRDAKARLFFELLGSGAVAAMNLDDDAGRWIAAGTQGARVVGYSTEGAESGFPVYQASELDLRLEGVRFRFRGEGVETVAYSHLVGRHNVYNVLGVSAMLLAAGIDPEAVLCGVNALKAVPGRLEQIRGGQPFLVVVDYAHSPDGLDKALDALGELPHRRIITVVGCGGDRDRTKRPVMGSIAQRKSDVAIITSDNPRTEDPATIIEEIVAGMDPRPAGEHILVDRETAIGTAIAEAGEGDVVLIAGKGHETYQEFADGRIDFDDRLVARRALEALGWTA